jgi:hypothetical protein
VKTARTIAWQVVLPLVVGVVIYVAWRREEVLLVSWLPTSTVQAARSGLGGWAVPRLILASGADAAWGWAFGAALALVWRGRKTRARTFWLVAGGAVAAYAEIGQLWGLPPGTFDIVDLVAIVGAYALAAFVVLRSARDDPRLRDPAVGGDGAVPTVPD